MLKNSSEVFAVIFTLLGLSLSECILAVGGRLPRGESLQNSSKVSFPKKETTKAKKMVPTVTDCFAHYATAIGTTGFFSNDGKVFYHFSPVDKPRKSKNTIRNWYYYNVHKISLSGKKDASVIAALDLPQIDAVIPHGKDFRGATAVIWSSPRADCKSGRANYVTIAFDFSLPNKKEQRQGSPRAVQDAGNVLIVNSNEQGYLFDQKRRAVLQLDLGTFQTRYSQTMTAKGERPLYIDLGKRLQYTWKIENTQKEVFRGLVAYRNANEPVSKLMFTGNDKLLIDNKLFGVAQYDLNTNSLRIKELARWSGRDKSQDFVVTLPANKRVDEGEFKPNFIGRKMMVLGKTRAIRKRWREAFIFDYEKGWEIGKLKVADDDYVSYGGISPDGSKAVVALAKVSSGLLSKFAVFSFNSRRWTDVSLPAK
ncbi:MAG: hypothetical protein R3B45_04385 [Bdellovibrionota bacterium]